jgi:hypothetical protein
MTFDRVGIRRGGGGSRSRGNVDRSIAPGIYCALVEVGFVRIRNHGNGGSAHTNKGLRIQAKVRLPKHTDREVQGH